MGGGKYSYRTTWTAATDTMKQTAVMDVPTRKRGFSSKDAMSDMNLFVFLFESLIRSGNRTNQSIKKGF